VQTCIVHLIRQSLRFVPDKHRRQVAKDLKPIYTAVDADQAAAALSNFDQAWGERYPMIGNTWRDTWEHVIPFLAFPPDLRRVVYTTNTIEALHRQIRKTIKTRGHFTTEDAARKLIYLAIQTPSAAGATPTTGAQHCSRSKSTSETDCPDPLTQEVGHPRRVPSFRFEFLRSVSEWIPRSRATCAIGRPLSSANRTPRSSSSSGYFLALTMTAEDLLSPGQHPGIEAPVKAGPAQEFLEGPDEVRLVLHLD